MFSKLGWKKSQKSSKVQSTRGRSLLNSFRFKPSFEQLEKRELPATGFLQGTVFVDSNSSGVLTTTDHYLAGATVFLDLNHDGTLDAGDPSVVTGTNGSYLFTNLTPGVNYQVVEIPPAGYLNTKPQILTQFDTASIPVNASNTIDVNLANPQQVTFNTSDFYNQNLFDVLNYSIYGSPVESSVGQIPVTASGTGLSPNPSNQFQTLCVDLFNQFNYGSQTYPVNPGSTIIASGSPQNAGEIAFLYNHFGTTTLPNAAESAGLQLAVWALEYGSSANLSAGNFQVLSGVLPYTSSTELAADISWANTFISDAAGKSETALFLNNPSLPSTPTATSSQGVIATRSFNFGNIAETPADLSIVKTDGMTSVVPGTNDTYTITVTNNGPSTVTGATVSDALPTGTTFVSATGGATYNGTSNSVSYTTGTLASGATTSFTVTLGISSSLTGTLANTATVTAPAGTYDGNPANNTSTDTDTLTPQNDVSVTKVDNDGGSSITPKVGSAVPGTSITYTITVSNAGPSTATNVAVSDPLSAGLTSFTWSGDGQSNVSGALSDSIASLAPGASVVYTVVATIDPSATAQLVNTVKVTSANDTNNTNNTAVDKDNLAPQNDVKVTKVDNDGGSSIVPTTGSAVPGTSITYTITVSNAGPSTATNVAVSDPLSTGLTSFTWSGNGHSNVSGAVSDTITSLAPGASVVYTVVATIDPAANALLVNTVKVTSANDTNNTNNTAVDKDNVAPQNDVSVTKVDNDGGSSITSTTGSAVPGTNITYTITVSNAGPSTATSVAVSDPLTTGLASFTWSGNGHSNVSGALSDTITSIAPGASVVYTVVAAINPTTTAQLVNTVKVTSANDTNTNNNTAVDKDNVTPQKDVSVTKVDNDGGSSVTPTVGSAVPGTTITYTVTVSNAGPSTATSVAVSDPLPTGITGFTWSGNGHSNVSGALSDTITSLAPGASVVYTVAAAINPTATAQLVNTVTVTSANDTNTTNNSAVDKDNLTPQNDVSVTKVDNDGGSSITPAVGNAVPGTTITYTVTVTNAGPSTATNVAVSDPLPTGITSFTWSGNGHSNVSGALSDTIGSLAPGSSVVYTVVAAINSTATAQLVNTVTVTSTNDTNTTNNTAVDKDNLTPAYDISVTKVDNDGGSSITSTTGSAVPGTNITYTITVKNAGPSTATSVAVSDPLPTGIGSFTWSGNGHTNVSGALSDTITSMASGSSVVYTVVAMINAGATAQLVNTATVSAANDTNAANNSASDKDNLTPGYDVSVTKVDNVGGSSITSKVGSAVPGTNVTYTIVVTNSASSPSTATNVVVSDAIPTGISSFTWSGDGQTNVTGALSDTIASLAPGVSVTYTVVAAVSPSATAQLSNAVTVTAANDTNTTNNTATDKDNLTPQNDVSVTKVDNDGGSSVTPSTGSAVPGTSITYTITVSNAGPSTATNVAVSDPLSTGLTSFTWSGDGQSNVSGPLADTITTLAPGASVVYTVVATIDPAATAQLVNTVKVTSTNDTNTANNTAVDKDNVKFQNDVSVTKVDNDGGSSVTATTGSAVPGTNITYTITVSNAGPSTATSVAVSDPLTTGFTSFTWSGDGHSNVSGALSDTITSLAPGASVVYTVVAAINPAANAQLVNTVRVTSANDTNTTNNSAVDKDNVAPQNDVSVTKVDNDGGSSVTPTTGSAVPGTSITYTITVSNAGPSTATSVAVSDPLSTGLTTFTWSGNGHTNVSGALSDTITSLAPGASVVYTVVATIDPAATAQLVNTVKVTSANDTNTTNNTAVDKDNVTPQNDVSVTKVDNDGGSSVTPATGSAVPGTSITYTITVSNAGPSTATSVAVSDPLSTGLTTFTWSGNGHTNVSGALSDTIASLAPGASVVYTVVATINPAATAQLVNTVQVTSANDTNTANNTAVDKDNVTPKNDVSVTKVDNDGGSSITGTVGSAATGSNITYTVTVTNSGPSTATNVSVSDPLPVLTGDTLVLSTDGPSMNVHTFSGSLPIIVFSSGQAVSGGDATGTLNGSSMSWAYCVDFDHEISIPGTYTTGVSANGSVNGNAVNNASEVAWLLDNFAGAATSADQQAALQAAIWKTIYGSQFQLDGADNSGSNDATLISDYKADLTALGSNTASVSGIAWLSPSNSDGSAAQGFAAGTCTPTTSFVWSGNGHTNVSGPLGGTITSLAPGASVTYTVVAGICSMDAGQLVNTATVTAANDTNSVNNTAVDKDNLTSKPADVTVTKTADTGSITAGDTAGFTVTITNTGGTTATGVTLSDPLPAGAGGDINWAIDTSNTGLGAGTIPADFTITGAVGSQVLTLSSAFNSSDTLAAGQTISVHYTGLTTTNDAVNTTGPLGTAANYEILYEGTGGHNLSISNVTIAGNIGVGGTGQVQFSGPGTILGRLDFAAANSGQYHNTNGSNVGPTTVNYNDSAVTTALNTVNSLSSALAGSGNSLTINGTQTINESAGQLVTVGGFTYRMFNVSSYSENNGNVVTINGDGSGDPVVLNFAYSSNTNLGGDVTLAGGLTEDQVIWNFTSSGKNIQFTNNASSYPMPQAFRGVILAPNDAINTDNASFVGRIFGGDSSDMQIVSGDNFATPAMMAMLRNVATVNAANEPAADQNNTSSATVTVASGTSHAVTAGDFATIGFWQNNNGQALINNLNGGGSAGTATNLGSWLANKFPHLYGSLADPSNPYEMNLTGASNATVASFYDTLFGASGLSETYAQIMANALAAYATDAALAGGTYAQAYGFNMQAGGSGLDYYNVGSNGSAIGLSNNSAPTVSNILAAIDLLAASSSNLNSNLSYINNITANINQTGDI